MLPYSKILELKQSLNDWWSDGDERCGIITAEGEVTECQNLAKEPDDRFLFQEEDLKHAAATWHTHPKSSANLSLPDFYFFKSWPEINHFIVSSTEVRCYSTFDGLLYVTDDETDYPPRLSR